MAIELLDRRAPRIHDLFINESLQTVRYPLDPRKYLTYELTKRNKDTLLSDAGFWGGVASLALLYPERFNPSAETSEAMVALFENHTHSITDQIYIGLASRCLPQNKQAISHFKKEVVLEIDSKLRFYLKENGLNQSDIANAGYFYLTFCNDFEIDPLIDSKDGKIVSLKIIKALDQYRRQDFHRPDRTIWDIAIQLAALKLLRPEFASEVFAVHGKKRVINIFYDELQNQINDDPTSNHTSILAAKILILNADKIYIDKEGLRITFPLDEPVLPIKPTLALPELRNY